MWGRPGIFDKLKSDISKIDKNLAIVSIIISLCTFWYVKKYHVKHDKQVIPHGVYLEKQGGSPNGN
tara:strand:+ start:173 stop:370 length:198 start_codon:yes stop_codon:yes gene_type:complete